MRHFQDGEEVRILRRGVETEVKVFRQCGEYVYIFDKENRPYQFHANDVISARRIWNLSTQSGMSGIDPRAEAAEASPSSQ